MKRTSNKKPTERRSNRSTRSQKGSSRPKQPPKQAKAERGRMELREQRELHELREMKDRTDSREFRESHHEKENCQNCSKNLSNADRALYVEEEVGRTFCSESCITAFFAPEIKRLEKEYFRRLSPNDISGEERENLAHLRWITLQESDETWREKTLSGDHRFTLISEFRPEEKKIWCICICLFLRGEPSFLYLAFSTRNAAMVNHYRKGERVQLVKREDRTAEQETGETNEPTDKLADAWTEDETIRAKLGQERSQKDISVDDFGLYQNCLEETLEAPDEVWSLMMTTKDTMKMYHFIRYYAEEKSGIWYVVVARETDDEEQIEILEAFPTRDSGLVDHYRKGEQEMGIQDSKASATRVVH